jgi:hypothetical protein
LRVDPALFVDITSNAASIKKEPRLSSRLFSLVGRGERIRTSDPQHPMLVRYQAALHPVNQRVGIMVYLPLNVKGKCRRGTSLQLLKN